MTNRYNNGTPVRRVPSRASVIRPALGALVMVVVTGLIAAGETFDGRHLLGMLVSILVTGVLFVRFADRASERHLVKMLARADRYPVRPPAWLPGSPGCRSVAGASSGCTSQR